ncbi:MAG: transcriptional repressor [Candidatus Cloacimonetes bacterium]|nr:transcriptional repressor [Candidatus Cloacimonadota bacterium]
MEKKKYKRSRQRDRILELLSQTDIHPTVDWIYDRLKKEFPKLSLGTVYRNLAILIEQGLILRIHSGSTFDRFEVNRGSHYHLICEKCGKIRDFTMPVNMELEREASRMTDFSIQGHRVDFYGICPECQGRK